MTHTGRSSTTKVSTVRGRRLPLLLCAALLLPMQAMASDLYVSDNLRVGVRDSAEESANTLTVITSGSQVELLDRSGSYIKVRTGNGVEGWVKSAYFSKNKPSRLLLAETQAQLRKMEKDLNELRSNKGQNNAIPDAQLVELKAEISQLKSREADLQQQLQEMSENGVFAADSTSSSINLREILNANSKLLLSSIGTLLVCLCLGFLVGVSWHRRQVTKRLGGLTL